METTINEKILRHTLPVIVFLLITALFIAPATADGSSFPSSQDELYALYSVPVSDGGSVYFPHDVIYCVIIPKGYTGDVTLTTRSDAEKPETGETFMLVDISIDEKKRINGVAFVQFKLPLATLEENGFGADDVCLYHYEGNSWVKLKTIYRVVDDIVYYESKTVNFSPFAVVFEEGGADSEYIPTKTPVTEEPSSPGFGLFAVLAGLGIVALRKINSGF